MQEDFIQVMQELEQRWTIRNAIRYNKYLSKPNITVVTNKEHQQRHQDHDAATRIQNIVCKFIICRQQQDAATKFQALI
eukprot:15333231-Ditylum_brightwellii.AAC.1